MREKLDLFINKIRFALNEFIIDTRHIKEVFMSPKYKRRYSAKSKKLLLYNYFASLVLGGLVVGTLVVFIIFAVFSRELPNPNALLERSAELSTKLYDRNNKPLFEVYGDKNRSLVKFEEISPFLVNATLATEDANFYNHQGFYLWGMLRALKNTFSGTGLQGGSTLTQQVVKNTLLTQDRTITRKLKELILSLQLENRYTKEEILQMYLNESPYGGQNYGVFTASKAYFNKHPSELSLAESAYIAGLPQSPTRYSYFGGTPEAGLARKDYVLFLMNDKGWVSSDGNRYFLSDDDYAQALEEELQFQETYVPFSAPHFVFYVQSVLADMFGDDFVEQGGLQVTTTLDLDLQDEAQALVYDAVENAAGSNVGNGALVALQSQTGQILAMVGSKGFFLDSEPEGCTSGITGEGSCVFEAQANVATALRQPGSAIKPITYATMLEQGYSAAYPLLDVPTTFPGASVDKPYQPENYDGKFRGPLSVRKSLGNSINISAVKALQIVGVDSMIDQAEKMGITSFSDRDRYGLAITLGGAETSLVQLTSAYSVFASRGIYRPPTPILKVTDASGNVLYEWVDNGGERALSEETSFLISDILSDDGARSAVFGFGSLLNIPGHQVAVKTGTTDLKRDNYAVGYTPDIVVGAWVGNNNNEAMDPNVASGITGATPAWSSFMKFYLKDKESLKFEPSNKVEKLSVDELTGGLPFDDFGKRQEWFVKGTEPTSVSDWYQKIEVCKLDGRIANDGCKNADETEVRTFVKITPLVPAWQTAVDRWVKENFNDKEEYFPPLMTSKLEFDGNDVKNKKEVHPEIVGVKDGQGIPPDFRLNVEVSSYEDVDSVKIYLDGEKVTEDKSFPWGYNFDFSSAQYGNHTFKVVAIDDDGNEGDYSIDLKVVPWVL